jgi:hypothetical protein
MSASCRAIRSSLSLRCRRAVSKWLSVSEQSPVADHRRDD